MFAILGWGNATILKEKESYKIEVHNGFEAEMIKSSDEQSADAQETTIVCLNHLK